MNQAFPFNTIIAAPFGAIGVRADSDHLKELVYLPPGTTPVDPATPLTKEIAHQLQCYFASPGYQFDLPLLTQGTDYQHRVWNAIGQIPSGQVVTYGQLARQIGSAPRAVGQACGANFYPLIIPCHRVTAAHGVGGFGNQDDAGSYHVRIKRWLLTHEGVHGY